MPAFETFAYEGCQAGYDQVVLVPCVEFPFSSIMAQRDKTQTPTTKELSSGFYGNRPVTALSSRVIPENAKSSSYLRSQSREYDAQRNQMSSFGSSLTLSPLDKIPVESPTAMTSDPTPMDMDIEPRRMHESFLFTQNNPYFSQTPERPGSNFLLRDSMPASSQTPHPSPTAMPFTYQTPNNFETPPLHSHSHGKHATETTYVSYQGPASKEIDTSMPNMAQADKTSNSMHFRSKTKFNNSQPVNLQEKVKRQRQMTSDLVIKEWRGEPMDGASHGRDPNSIGSNCREESSNKFLAFRQLVKQFHGGSRSPPREKTKTGLNETTLTRHAGCHDKNEYQGKPHHDARLFGVNSYLTANTAMFSESTSAETPSTSTNPAPKPDTQVILSFFCPELKIKDPLVYLNFPFFSIEGEQLKPFLKGCFALDKEARNTHKDYLDDLNFPSYDLEKSTWHQPMRSSGLPDPFNHDQTNAFISEFAIEDLAATITAIEQAFVIHLGYITTKLSLEKKQKIIDVYVDLRRLRERVFGPMSTLRAELHHEIFDATGINVDISREMMEQYTDRINQHMPNILKVFCSIPGFMELGLKDRNTLVTECLVEYWYLGWYANVEHKSGILIDVERKVVLSIDLLCDSFPEVHDMAKCQMVISERLQKLDLTPAEVIMLKTLVLLCPSRMGLEEPVRVDALLRRHRESLRFLLYQNHTDPEDVLSGIEAHVVELRGIISQCGKDRAHDILMHITNDESMLTSKITLKVGRLNK